MSQNKIDEALSYVRQKYGLQNRPATIPDFFKICKTEKVAVNRDKYDFGCKGMFLRCADFCMIWLAPYLNYRLLRKVAFHELGHYFLHRNLTQKIYEKLTRIECLSIEKEATFFAKSLMFGGVECQKLN